MDVQTMEEKNKILQARREARRQKILQNAGNRLKLITGANEEPPEQPECAFNSFESSMTTVEQPFEEKVKEKILESLLTTIDEPNSTVTENIEPQIEPLESDTLIIETSPVFEQRFYVLLVASSILTCFLCKLGYYDYSVVMPFTALEIISLIFREGKINTMFQTFLVLSKFNPNLVQKFLYILSKCENMVKDFSVYFFTFLIFQFLCEIVKF